MHSLGWETMKSLKRGGALQRHKRCCTSKHVEENFCGASLRELVEHPALRVKRQDDFVLKKLDPHASWYLFFFSGYAVACCNHHEVDAICTTWFHKKTTTVLCETFSLSFCLSIDVNSALIFCAWNLHFQFCLALPTLSCCMKDCTTCLENNGSGRPMTKQVFQEWNTKTCAHNTIYKFERGILTTHSDHLQFDRICIIAPRTTFTCEPIDEFWRYLKHKMQNRHLFEGYWNIVQALTPSAKPSLDSHFLMSKHMSPVGLSRTEPTPLIVFVNFLLGFDCSAWALFLSFFLSLILCCFKGVRSLNLHKGREFQWADSFEQPFCWDEFNHVFPAL